MFFLTEGPHLFYCNIRNKKIIDDIPFSKDMTVETFDLRKFYIFTLKVKYKLRDEDFCSDDWCTKIIKVKEFYFK